MNDDIDKIKKFCEDNGVNKHKKYNKISISDIIDFTENGLTGKTTEEVEDMVMKIHAMSLNLKNQKSSIEAIMKVNSKKIDSYVTENLSSTANMYVPFEYKKKFISNKNKDIQKLVSQNEIFEAKLSRIKDLPNSLDKIVYSIECYMKRRYS